MTALKILTMAAIMTALLPPQPQSLRRRLDRLAEGKNDLHGEVDDNAEPIRGVSSAPHLS